MTIDRRRQGRAQAARGLEGTAWALQALLPPYMYVGYISGALVTLIDSVCTRVFFYHMKFEPYGQRLGPPQTEKQTEKTSRKIGT